MGEQAGKDLLLKVNTTGSTYITIGGLRSKSLSLNNEEIDVTNHGSNENKTLLDGAGIKSLAISGSGVHTGDAATLDLIQTNCLAGTLTNFQIVDASSGGRTYQASFKITSFEHAGEFNAEQTFSISLSSSGQVTVS